MLYAVKYAKIHAKIGGHHCRRRRSDIRAQITACRACLNGDRRNADLRNADRWKLPNMGWMPNVTGRTACHDTLLCYINGGFGASEADCRQEYGEFWPFPGKAQDRFDHSRSPPTVIMDRLIWVCLQPAPRPHWPQAVHTLCHTLCLPDVQRGLLGVVGSLLATAYGRVRVRIRVNVIFIVDSLWTIWTRRRLEAHVYR